MDLVKKYGPSVLPAIAALWAVYGTQIQNLIAAHPSATAVIGAAYAVFAHLMPSPIKTASS